MLRAIGLILATILLTIVLLQGRSPAQTTANLEADVSNLKSQVSQLRSEVAQLRSQRGSTTPVAPVPPASQRYRSPDLSESQMIDRLAILAIEAKDRLTALEKRVTQLEKKVR